MDSSGDDCHVAAEDHREGIDDPVCSVLITCIDHIMCSPSPLESEEFGDDSCQVSVLRIFGPIIRRDARRSIQEPYQSACLYVHGAFPYLLARPVVAGPDGSIHQSAHLKQTQRSSDSDLSDYTDWDSVEAVGRIVPVLQQILEETIQSNMLGFGGEDSNAVSKARAQTRRVIRQIRVVLGRGFYTYCPGAPAPFLRVEYYDPSQRWRIKAALERGLDVPLVYHPDPLQYQASVHQGQREEGEDVGALRFHCYEAHIPYTMQFFKDWNLAGSSYIHLSHGLFRRPLPASSRKLWHAYEAPQQYFLFLDSNTPPELVWDGPQAAASAQEESAASPSKASSAQESSPLLPIAALQQASQSSDDGFGANFPSAEGPGLLSPPKRVSSKYHSLVTFNQAGLWSNKCTSCDVEFDVSVHEILNVHDVMKDLPLDDSERLKVHWRAVPSLREIWSEERRRMSKLLRPKDDFLSHPEETDKQPQFTLSVKNAAPLPGARLAREGMQRLIQVTDGLEEDFRRVMSDIVERHKEDVVEVDNILQKHSRTAKGGASKANVPKQSPTDDEAMLALEQLKGLFSGDAVSPHWQSQQSIQSSINSQASLNYPNSQESSAARPRSASERFKVFSQAYYSQENISQASSQVRDDFELSQRVDRGESLVDGPFEHVEDFIDHETLLPFEMVDDDDDGSDEEDIDESALEHKLMTFATQTLRESHEESVACTRPSPQPTLTRSQSDRQEISDECVQDLIPSVPEPQSDAISKPWLHPASISIELREVPPLRKEVIGPTACILLPMHQLDSQPSWMTYTSQYEQLRISSGLVNDWFPLVGQSGIDICLTRPAPARKTVSSWSRRELKRQMAQNESVPSNSKRIKSNGMVEAPVARIDENSRRLVFDAGAEGQEVEEVEWRLDQNIMSQTQQSQKEKESIFFPNGKAKVLNSIDESQDSGVVSLPTLSRSPVSESFVDSPNKPLQGIGNQGGRLLVEGGGQLKAKTRPSQGIPALTGVASHDPKHKSPYLTAPVSLMTIEVHIQCRSGRAGSNDSREMAMTPDSDRDKVFAVVYLYGRDPGGGDSLQVLERGCIFVPLEREFAKADSASSSTSCCAELASLLRSSLPSQVMGYSAPVTVECVKDERQLLLRLAAIVRWTDPDILMSWDTQGAGLGYLIERGAAMGKSNGSTEVNGTQRATELDMARLLGRTPTVSSVKQSDAMGQFGSKVDLKASTPAKEGKEGGNSTSRWKGSGMGTEWDDRVGAGSAAASIVGRLVFAAWKLVAEEVKHPNASYLQAVASAVLGQRIPFHDNLKLTEWYGHNGGRERWRTLHHKLIQAATCLRLFDALDIIGRAGEAARLSGVEFSQSFPGIRGSQYKVEGVLLRALQSLNSEERGSKRGRVQPSNLSCGGISSLSSESKSQTQSPWKVRRRALPTEKYVLCEDDARWPVDRGYFFYSPSLQDTNRQEALQVQALTLEPLSGHHQDPVIVCDFTALYPSLVIAYNLCYSTVCGHLEYHSTRMEMRQSGHTTGRIGPFLYPEGRTSTVLSHHMKSLDEGDARNDRAYVSPTGTIYVAESVLKGVLPQVLDEMLSTRAMLKKAAKQYTRLVPDLSPSILRQLEARQLALKYVANVTYGYTSATFSGRCAMPLLADTIVETGRRTLTNAINLANEWGRQENGKWQGAQVLYGDTDSVFVRLPGRSVQEAFRFGEEFCAAVTARNPPPVQLKLEKVYLGSVLQTKKRYCGMKFESKDQKKPTFEAKGLETVRRDQCALTQKILKNCLVMLFQRGPEAVKAYMFRQWALILSGKLPVSDFVLTGRVRSRYRNGSMGPVQAALARRLAEADPGRVVRHGERLPYVIVATPGLAFTLRNSVVTPMELLEQWDAYTINTAYYIKKHVNAALQRCLGLAPHNIDVDSWYTSCPKPRRRIHFWPVRRSGNNVMISSYFGSDVCTLCGRKCKYTPSDGGRGGGGGGRGRYSKAAVCADCRRDVTGSVEAAMRRLSAVQCEARDLARQCSNCNQCFEDASTFAEDRILSTTTTTTKQGSRGGVLLLGGGGGGVVSPLANCTCIDCPITYERHRVREAELEALALCDALDALD